MATRRVSGLVLEFGFDGCKVREMAIYVLMCGVMCCSKPPRFQSMLTLLIYADPIDFSIDFSECTIVSGQSHVGETKPKKKK